MVSDEEHLTRHEQLFLSRDADKDIRSGFDGKIAFQSARHKLIGAAALAGGMDKMIDQD